MGICTTRWTSRFDTSCEPEMAWIFFASAIILFCIPKVGPYQFLVDSSRLCNSHSCRSIHQYPSGNHLDGSTLFYGFFEEKHIKIHKSTLNFLIWSPFFTVPLDGWVENSNPSFLGETPNGLQQARHSGHSTCSNTLAPWFSWAKSRICFEVDEVPELPSGKLT